MGINHNVSIREKRGSRREEKIYRRREESADP
jgi:hypothetical protein